MKITIKVHHDEILEKKYLPVYLLIKKNKWHWQGIGAGMALGGGLSCPIIGAGLDLLVSYTRLGYERPALHKISIIFYVMTVPLLMLGSHFIDLLEKKALDLSPVEANSINQTIGKLELQAKTEDC